MEKNKKELKQRICVYSKEFDVDLDYQENLEPYNDEMLKILRSSVSNSIVSTDYNNGTLTVHGKSKIQITYFNNRDKGLSFIEFDEDFEKSVNIEAQENSHFDIRLCNKYSSARIINPTRIDIHNSFSVSVSVYAEKSICALSSADGLLLKEKKIKSISFVSSAQVKSEFDDETAIPADSPPINRVINTFTNIIEDESKIVENKMLVKARVDISVLYLTEDNTYERFEKSISVNSILDIQGILEADTAFNSLSVSSVYIKPKADKNNEYRSFEIIGELVINSAIYRESEQLLPVDAYSVERSINTISSPIEINSDYSIINDTITEKYTINTDKQNIAEVLDLSADVSNDNSVEISAFVTDDTGSINLITSKNKTELNGFNEISINILSADYVILSENEVEVRVSMSYAAVKYNPRNENIISSFEISDESGGPTPALSVYFADEGEEIWDIAKKFRTSPQLIKSENDLTKETIDSKRILIIPGM